MVAGIFKEAADGEEEAHGRADLPAGRQVIAKLREAEVLQANGLTMPEICKQLGVTDQTYYRWRKEYGDFVSIRRSG